MPNITTNVGTRTSTVVWTVKEVAGLTWMLSHGMFPANVTNESQAMEYILTSRYLTLKVEYFNKLADLRQEAYDVATPTQQANADAAIGFNPNV